MRILGIDPGYALIGFGLIEAERGQTRMLTYGTITTPAGQPLAKRLYQISQDMDKLFETLKPDAVSIEELFFRTNLKTGIAVAHGRGVILCVILLITGILIEITLIPNILRVLIAYYLSGSPVSP